MKTVEYRKQISKGIKDGSIVIENKHLIAPSKVIRNLSKDMCKEVISDGCFNLANYQDIIDRENGDMHSSSSSANNGSDGSNGTNGSDGANSNSNASSDNSDNSNSSGANSDNNSDVEEASPVVRPWEGLQPVQGLGLLRSLLQVSIHFSILRGV